MPEDKIIKAGQLTLPRILFLAGCGAALFIIVASGQLGMGYLLVSAVLCLLLFLVVIDYRVDISKVNLPERSAQQVVVTPQIPAETARAVGREARPQRRRSSRPAKRRR